MKVLSFIPNATHFGYRGQDVYWIESDPEQFARLVYPLLPAREREKIDPPARSYIADQTGSHCTQGHIYFLADAGWSRFVIETLSMPHSGMWNACSPFRQIAPFTFQTVEEFQHKTFVGRGGAQPVQEALPRPDCGADDHQCHCGGGGIAELHNLGNQINGTN
jgi:hypothetical protein